MSRVKYQHYVPRLYLVGFESNGKLWCYDKHLDKAYEQSAERLGGGKFFYDLPEAESQLGDRQFLEKWFNPLETEATSILRQWRAGLNERKVFDPSDSDLEVMALFLTVQLMRTAEARRQAVDLTSLAMKMSFFDYLGEQAPDLAAKLENPFEGFRLEIPEDRWAYVHATTLLNGDLIEELAKNLLNHIWIVFQNATPSTFYTSDQPVLTYPHAKHPIRTMSGLASPGVQIIYPLLPNFSLSLLERNFWAKLSHFHRKLWPQPLAPENVEFENSLHVLKSSRFVFCRDDDFALARDMCKEDPALRDYKRGRIIAQRLSEKLKDGG